jgi:hypothetical protein
LTTSNAIYLKSAKGAEAIATRQHGLTPKLRSLLILIDGKRSVAELTRLAGMLGDVEQLLSQLLEQGCIDTAAGVPLSSGQTQPSGAAGTLGAAAGGSTPAVSLPEAQRFAVRRLTDILGPSAESLCLRIEAARTAQEFTAILGRAEAVVRDFRGADVAARFASDMQARWPRP